MRLEDLLPSLREGRRARRPSWKPGYHIAIDLVGDRRAEHLTKKERGVESAWPNSQTEARDLLAEDWELMPELPKDGYVPGNYKDAFDALFSEMRSRNFDPFHYWTEKRRPGPSGVRETGPDFDWRTICRQAIQDLVSCIESGQLPQYTAFGRTSEDRDLRARQREALLRAACTALQALGSHMAEEYVEQVMER